MRATPFPGEPVDERERALITIQLGRPSRGEIAVAARCEYGLPAVVRTAPQLDDGSPFPTLYWLACPMAVRAISRLESAGRMREFEERLGVDAALAAGYRRAHESYVARRAALGGDPNDPAVSAGGMPARIKCLHALYAHEVAEGNPVGALARSEVEPLGCPGPCVTVREGALVATEGHPGFP